MNAILNAIDRRLEGTLGASIVWLDTNERWGLRDGETFPTASGIKIQILAALFERARRDKLSLSRRIKVRSRDVVPGSGVLGLMAPGVEPTLRDLAVLMTVISDNTATNMLIDFLGLDALNEQICGWGYEKTIVWRKINFNADPGAPRWFGESTPGETADLLARVARRELLGKRHDAEIEAILARQKFDTALPRYLPGSGAWDDDHPEFVVAHKTGSVRGVRVDSGIITSPIGRYVIAAFAKDLADQRYHPDNAGQVAIGKLNARVYAWLKKRYGN